MSYVNIEGAWVKGAQNISEHLCPSVNLYHLKIKDLKKKKQVININKINASWGRTVFMSPPLALKIVRNKMTKSYEYFSQFSMY